MFFFVFFVLFFLFINYVYQLFTALRLFQPSSKGFNAICGKRKIPLSSVKLYHQVPLIISKCSNISQLRLLLPRLGLDCSKSRTLGSLFLFFLNSSATIHSNYFLLFGKWAWNKQHVKVSKLFSFTILYKTFYQSLCERLPNLLVTFRPESIWKTTHRSNTVHTAFNNKMERYDFVQKCTLNVIKSLHFNTTLAVLLAFISICTAIAAWQWLVDPETMQVSFLYSLYNHLFFTIASLLLGKYYSIPISIAQDTWINGASCLLQSSYLFVGSTNVSWPLL